MNEETKKLHPRVGVERVERVWDRIEVSRSAGVRKPARVPKGRGLALLVAAAAALLVWHPWTEVQSDALPLTWQDGAPLAEAFDGPSRVGLSDGSWLTLDEGARVAVVNNSGRVVEFVQRSGRVHYSVEGQGRQWRIDAGRASVEIVGTVFVIERTEEDLRVNVEEGVVLVRSEHITDGVARVTAGDDVVIHQTRAPRPLPVEQEEAPSMDAEVIEEPSSMTAVSPRRRVATPLDAAALMNAADAARRAGRRGEAEELLEQAIRLSDSDSDLAALTLARSLQRSAPSRASRLYAQAVDLGLAEPLRREALRGEAECVEAAGGNATSVWRRFYDAYPDEPVRILP